MHNSPFTSCSVRSGQSQTPIVSVLSKKVRAQISLEITTVSGSRDEQKFLNASKEN
jgi:hypothetical protein